ncbi:membrane protein DedA with SNARE-associated domain [Paenibacillus taihuensis]|uniref:Membrane protein DedA with SNARE-associated domain n=1 Tax=Paenibacillus taihuensis TaxID=1156355 RepID=A0A3D9RPU7_9BACL|nr:DedA family protein [Paenibacillus taihuensis]REE78930.1 membrane protein DedA with SNARE-associated domain [Paenibacillus taihuensis]
MEHLLELLIFRYGYVGLMLALALGIVGIPVPDEALLTYSGFLVNNGTLHMVWVMLCAFIGAAAGITASYGIGIRFGLPFLLKFGPKLHMSPAKIERAQGWMNKYGNFLLFAGFFVPGLRHMTAYMAGMSRLKLRTFMLYSYAGALIWSTLFIYVGYVLGERWLTVKHYVHHYGSAFIIYGAIAVLALISWRVLRSMRKVKT